MNVIAIAMERPDQPDVIDLLGASDRYHAALYPAASNHLVDVASLLAGNVRFFVARDAESRAVGCGGVLLAEACGTVTAELKRMWVDPSVRGVGLGRRLLAHLEGAAAEQGATLFRLETGIRQPKAIALYRAAGYAERQPFGHYTADPLSLFMEKAAPIQSA
ncbi:MAG: GNAT family N-acetyltransferase [Hyphomicrobiaceae bacterium]